jgi:hypothetical protein
MTIDDFLAECPGGVLPANASARLKTFAKLKADEIKKRLAEPTPQTEDLWAAVTARTVRSVFATDEELKRWYGYDGGSACRPCDG